MTALARSAGLPGAVSGRHVTSPPDGARALIACLRAECDRQVPFSQTKLLFRQAASAIERLEAEVARLTAELAADRPARQAP
jgi:hypothetical protein